MVQLPVPSRGLIAPVQVSPLASWIVERVAERDAEQDAATVGHIKALESQLADVRGMLAEALGREK